MPRFLVNLPDPMLAWLRAESERLGVSVSELIRRFVDAKREAQERK